MELRYINVIPLHIALNTSRRSRHRCAGQTAMPQPSAVISQRIRKRIEEGFKAG